MGHSCENAMPIKIEEDACGKVCCWCHTGTHQYKNRYTHKHSHCIANARKTKATISVVFAGCVKNKYSKVGYIKKKVQMLFDVIEHSHWTNILHIFILPFSRWNCQKGRTNFVQREVRRTKYIHSWWASSNELHERVNHSFDTC